MAEARTVVLEQVVVARLLQHLPVGLSSVRTEQWFQGKRIDVVALDMSRDEVVAVEVKVRRWRDAVRQAYLNQLTVDRAFVAVWHQHASAVDVEVLQGRGIGLMLVSDDSVEVALPAQPAPFRNPALVDRMRRSLMGVACP